MDFFSDIRVQLILYAFYLRFCWWVLCEGLKQPPDPLARLCLYIPVTWPGLFVVGILKIASSLGGFK